MPLAPTAIRGSGLTKGLVAAGVLVAALAAAPRGAQAATLTVVVRGIEPGGGRVFVSLCTGGLAPQDCPVGTVVQAAGNALSVSFPAVAPGTYAVAVFQDTNGDGVLDRTRNGLPLEPYGFSNASGRAATPRFDRAAFTLGGDGTVTVRLASLATRR